MLTLSTPSKRIGGRRQSLRRVMGEPPRRKIQINLELLGHVSRKSIALLLTLPFCVCGEHLFAHTNEKFLVGTGTREECLIPFWQRSV